LLFFLLFSREEISPGRLSVVGPGVITSAADDSRPASASSPALSRLAFVRETGERGKRQSGPNYYFLWAQDVSSTSSQRIPPLWRYSGTCQRPDGKTLSTFPFSCWCSVVGLTFGPLVSPLHDSISYLSRVGLVNDGRDGEETWASDRCRSGPSIADRRLKVSSTLIPPPRDNRK